MTVGSMPCHKVQNDSHAKSMGTFEEPYSVLVSSVARRYFSKVGDIVTGIAERGFKNRVQPQRVDAKGF